MPAAWFTTLYDELKTLAASYMQREAPGHTLQPTALLHDAFVRLSAQDSTGWKDRKTFFAAAAVTMRRLLVDHARARQSDKRGGDRKREPLAAVVDELEARAHDLVSLNGAIEKLAAMDERKARVVELRFFAGFTVDETAELLGISPRTVAREWILARSWLLGELEESDVTLPPTDAPA